MRHLVAVFFSKNLKNKKESNAMKGDKTTWFTAQSAAQKTRTQPWSASTAAQPCKLEPLFLAGMKEDEWRKNASGFPTAVQLWA
jgi:hypothetical protein